MFITLHPQSLSGLHTLAVRANFSGDQSSGQYVPLLKSDLEKSIESLIQRNGMILDRSAPVQLTSDVRTKVMNPLTDMVLTIVKIETVLREPVTIERSSVVTVVDTWRHTAVIGVYSGIPRPSDLSNLIQTEATRQVETFLSECQSNGGTLSKEEEFLLVDSPRAKKAKELLQQAAVYPDGCSDFVCKVLGIPHENANSLMGPSPTYVGDNNQYSGLVSGDIVGWIVGGGQGHVAVYVGEAGKKFIDVKEPGAKPRPVIRGYGNGRPLFKSTRF